MESPRREWDEAEPPAPLSIVREAEWLIGSEDIEALVPMPRRPLKGTRTGGAPLGSEST